MYIIQIYGATKIRLLSTSHLCRFGLSSYDMFEWPEEKKACDSRLDEESVIIDAASSLEVIVKIATKLNLGNIMLEKETMINLVT